MCLCEERVLLSIFKYSLMSLDKLMEKTRGRQQVTTCTRCFTRKHIHRINVTTVCFMPIQHNLSPHAQASLHSSVRSLSQYLKAAVKTQTK